MCGLNEHDKSIADINPSFLSKTRPAVRVERGLAPQGLGTLRRPNIFKRVCKAISLFCKTRYSWATSWAQAGCDYDYR